MHRGKRCHIRSGRGPRRWIVVPGEQNDRENEYARAISDRAFVMERVTYRSDDLEVYAYLYRPAAPPKGEKLPVVVFNRGSYVRDDFSPEVLMLGNRLAREGYVVVAPMLRGSGGAQGRDEMGGADIEDLTNIVSVIKEIPYADPTRLFLYGESRGGMMCLLAAKHDFPALAIAVYGTITDFGSFLAEGSPARQIAPTVWPGFPANEAEIVESRSAMHWPEQISLPVLLMNGGADSDVSPLQAIQLASTLEQLGKQYRAKDLLWREACPHRASIGTRCGDRQMVPPLRRIGH